jgi:methyl-accepting chemotaxis protein
MAHQNAALVHQATTAADAMRDQASELSDLVRTFKV